jgi:hypothetical protein
VIHVRSALAGGADTADAVAEGVVPPPRPRLPDEALLVPDPKRLQAARVADRLPRREPCRTASSSGSATSWPAGEEARRTQRRVGGPLLRAAPERVPPGRARQPQRAPALGLPAREGPQARPPAARHVPRGHLQGRARQGQGLRVQQDREGLHLLRPDGNRTATVESGPPTTRSRCVVLASTSSGLTRRPSSRTTRPGTLYARRSVTSWAWSSRPRRPGARTGSSRRSSSARRSKTRISSGSSTRASTTRTTRPRSGNTTASTCTLSSSHRSISPPLTPWPVSHSPVTG